MPASIHSRLAVPFLLCLAATPAAAAVEETTAVRYYEVGGDSPARIWDEMRAKGPTGRDGGRYNATTQWRVRWRFPFDRSAVGCATGPVTVSLAITYHLPRWEGPPGTSSAVARQWERYIEALEEHEEGHADFGREAAARIEKELEALRPHSSCEAINREANALGQRILAETGPAEREYDRETNHGATQGTRFFRELAGR